MCVVLFVAGLAVGIVVSALASGVVDKWLDKKKGR